MKKKIISLAVILGFILTPIIALAACDPDKICLDNPIGTTNITQIMGNLVAQALTVMGSLALVVFIIGGFMWVTSGGNADRVKKGTQAMMWAAIGIIVIFSSYAIIKLVLSGIGANPTSTFTPSSEPVEEKKNECYCKVDGDSYIKMFGPKYDGIEKCLGSDNTHDQDFATAGGEGLLSECKWYLDDELISGE